MAIAAGVFLLVTSYWGAGRRRWAVERLWGPLVRAADGGTARAALLSALAYTGALLLFGALQAGTYALFGDAPARAAALVLGIVYAPLALMPIPDQNLYRDIRRHLAGAGATPGQARACAWTLGPLGFLALVALGSSVLYAFFA
jgi:hypothetical protein